MPSNREVNEKICNQLQFEKKSYVILYYFPQL